ncbi:MAG: sigma-54-dependent Fis family transcriptional regulator [Nitrospinae bacterium]|nr:sigma-54-dependent Fis family transcriptional regulator [Nitrospinota bacterium]
MSSSRRTGSLECANGRPFVADAFLRTRVRRFLKRIGREAGQVSEVAKSVYCAEEASVILEVADDRGKSGSRPAGETTGAGRETVATRKKIPLRFSTIIGSSPKLMATFNTVSKLADTDSTVLVLGESGSGKELFARAIHHHSPRRNGNFVAVNCGAIPEELLESELFGHEKGSFTGAIRTRVGKFEMAHEGTIFLDEIGDMSPTLQVKLLRILQQQEFERVGGNQVIKTDVRVLAATNQNLERAIREKKFREDLYYRLNVIPLKIPPLRERKDDVPALTDAFIKKFNRTRNRAVTGVSAAAISSMTAYDWPGNVRELENVCERMVVIKGEGRIEAEDLPPHVLDPGAWSDAPSPDMLLVGALEEEAEAAAPSGRVTEISDAGINLKEVVEEYEMTLILGALEKCDWVKNKAATLLGLNRTTLVEKLKKRGITR